MNLSDLMTRLRATKAVPTEEEAALVIAEGSYQEVGEAMVLTGCLHKGLKKRFIQLQKELRAPSA